MSPNVALLKTDDGDIALTIRISSRARHIGLRIDPRLGGAELVLPKGVSKKRGLSFARSKTDWLLDHLAALPAPVLFADGADIPYLGLPHRIRHIPQASFRRRPVWREEGYVFVSGETAHIARRVQDWLKAEARREMTARALACAAALEVVVKSITLRDPHSRWGSCSTRGILSFSWRLILAPENVLDYVVVHEVAHLAELNHGPKFWALVESRIADVGTARDWLRLHGASLHRFGVRREKS
jgi:predicted metal-dependent hydrolase